MNAGEMGRLEGVFSVNQTAARPQRELLVEPERESEYEPVEEGRDSREHVFARLRVVWSERRFLFRLACAGLAVSTLVAFAIPKQYVSTTQLMPPDSQGGSNLALMAGLAGGQMGGLGAVAGDLLGMKSTGALFIGVLRSRTVEGRIVERFDLKKVYGLRLEVSARERLAEKTSIGEDRKSGIITLTVTDRDPKRAAAITGAYVEELDTMMAQLTTSSAHRERTFLEERLSAVKGDLESAEREFSQFASKNATIDITEQGKAMVGAAATVEGQLMGAQAALEGLKQIYTDDNVRVRSIQARINELRRQLREVSGKAGTGAEAKEAGTDAGYPTLRQLPILGVPYADLFRRLKVEEAVYETLTKEYELAKVEEAKEIPTVKVLDAAAVPEKKSYPPRLLYMFLGTLGAVALGVLWVGGKTRWREIDSGDPGKLFAEEIISGVKARLERVMPNGHKPEEGSEEFHERPTPAGGQPGN
jgi:capsule polysaccharide export protein KpsE/RkpR